MSGLSRLAVAAGPEPHRLQAEAAWVGGDLVVTIWGGDKAHVGAVAAATPRPSLDDPDRVSATASVIAFVGHKEDLLARQSALALAAALNTRVVVTAGMHWDGLGPEGIMAVEQAARELVAKLTQALTA